MMVNELMMVKLFCMMLHVNAGSSMSLMSMINGGLKRVIIATDGEQWLMVVVNA